MGLVVWGIGMLVYFAFVTGAFSVWGWDKDGAPPIVAGATAVMLLWSLVCFVALVAHEHGKRRR